VSGVPTYIVLGPDGAERARLVGFVPAERLRDALARPEPEQQERREARG